MVLTYQLFDKNWRATVDLREYEVDIEYVINSFPMITLIQVTEDDFTIEVNTSNPKVKNRIVKALGRKMASDYTLSAFVVYAYGSFRLIVEKK